MTCITAVVDKDTVYMGGDSAGVAGMGLTIRKDPKVFINGPFIIGYTGSFRMGQLLRYKFHPPKQNIHQEDDMQYLVTDFIDSARQCFSINGFGDKDATMGGTFLLGYKGKLYTIEKDYQVGIPAADYDAVGCGADLALGSLHSTAKLNINPEDRIVLAMQAATEFSAGVSPPYTFLKQQYVDPNQKSVSDKKTKNVKSKK